jgi:hypothetical protein
MKNTPKRISYTVSAIAAVGQLVWNTSNITHAKTLQNARRILTETPYHGSMCSVRNVVRKAARQRSPSKSKAESLGRLVDHRHGYGELSSGVASFKDNAKPVLFL